MSAYNMRYLVQPKPALLDKLGERHTFTISYFINYREPIRVFSSLEDKNEFQKRNLIKGKMSFLLNIISQIRSGKYIASTIRDANGLFGVPAKYDETTFDRWWSIQIVRLTEEIHFEEIILTASYDDCNILGTASDSGVNEFFLELCQIKKQS